MVKLNRQAAVVLLDLGCTTDAVSPELVCIADLNIYKLTEPVPVQLGTRGSQAKINYGTEVCIKYGHIDMKHYFDIVNIDRYNVILGMVFMRKHGIMLDFDKNKIRHKKEVLPELWESPDVYLLVCRVKQNEPKRFVDIPHLCEEWMKSCEDIMRGALEKLLPLRDVNHRIPLVDEEKRYKYHNPCCLDSLKPKLAEKIAHYMHAGWWEQAQAEQLAPMLCVRK
ncbi:hypothetical protein L208DRAFT_1059114, partial [Tricholoma matsutake]